MINLAEAMNKEKEYHEYRQRGIVPFVFCEELKKIGYKNLEEYFLDKNTFLFQQQNPGFYKMDSLKDIAYCLESFQSGNTVLVFGESEGYCVYHGTDEINMEYCEKNSIPLVPIHTSGGVIVNTPGDFAVCVCNKKEGFNNEHTILQKIGDILQSHTDKIISVSGNDILVNNKKVCGSVGYRNENMFMLIAYFSFSDKFDLIKKICTTKKTGKEIGYIDFMSRLELEGDIYTWLLK